MFVIFNCDVFTSPHLGSFACSFLVLQRLYPSAEFYRLTVFTTSPLPNKASGFGFDWSHTCRKKTCSRLRVLQFIANLAQKVLSPFDVRLTFNALGCPTVDNTHDAASLAGFGDDDLDRIGRGAENSANLGYHFD